MAAISLGEATRRAVAAAGAGDFDALSIALAARAAAIATASPAEQAEALAAGETIGRLLTEIRRDTVSAHNRLEQLRSAFARRDGQPLINLRA